MSIALTFSDKELLASPVMGPDRRLGSSASSTGATRTFTLNGVERKWDELKSRSDGIFSSEREEKELIATPNFGSEAGAVRFTTYRAHLLHESQRAVLYFPHELQDESERMFLLMAILHMDTTREDRNEAAAGG
ncbi:hypothetical protein FB451DRAFT_1557127 [Mycena latifolia]|nr:hypothetical protein FB451DRAFT_1557127 [Mycena latifolia]